MQTTHQVTLREANRVPLRNRYLKGHKGKVNVNIKIKEELKSLCDKTK